MALLSRVVLTNFGCFPRLDVPLAPLTVLVGPNDSGKTTFLKSLLVPRVELAMLSGRASYTLEMPRPLWAGADPAGHQATVTLQGPGERAPLSQVEGRWECDWHVGAGGASRGRYEPRDMDPFVEQRLWQPLWNTLRNTRLVHFSPRALRMPSPPARGAQVPELAEDGAGLPTVLSVLAGAEPERFAAIQEQFRKAVPSLAGFRVLPTHDGQHRLVFRLAGDQGQIEAGQASEGALLFLGFLTLLHHPNPASLLLVEEPETGVHPGRLKNIVKLLRTLTRSDGDSPGAQIIMTTHSPYLLDEMAPGEVLVFRRDASGAADAICMDSIPDMDDRLSDYKLGELWAAYEEDRLHELARGR